MDNVELEKHRTKRNRKDWGTAGRDGRVRILTALRLEPGVYERVHDISDLEGRVIARMLGDWVKEGVERWEASQKEASGE